MPETLHEMTLRVKARDLMTLNPLSVFLDFTLETVEQVMHKRNLSHVLVLDQGKLVGIITDGDIRKHRHPRAGSPYATAEENRSLLIKAHQIMTRNPRTISDETPLAEILQIFSSVDYHALPVVDEHHTLLGIIVTRDVIRSLHRASSTP